MFMLEVCDVPTSFFANQPLTLHPQVEFTAPSYTSSEAEEEEEDQDNLEDRKYPGEVTTSSFKVKFQAKDSKKELLV